MINNIDDSCTSPLNYASAEDIQEVRNAIISEQEEIFTI